MSDIEAFRLKYAATTYSEIRTLIRESADFRSELEVLYVSLYHTGLNKRCTDCWLDAYIALTKTNLEHLIKMQERQFELKAGALLIDKVNGDNSKMVTRNNLTDELALYHLRTNPSCIKKFSKYPTNWQDMVAGIGTTDSAEVAGTTETTNRGTILFSARDTTKKAETALKGAKTRLNKAIDGGNPATITKAEQRLSKAEAVLLEAQNQLQALEA